MLPLSISARGLSSCRLLGKLWPLPRIRREASTWTPSSFDPPRQIRAYYLNSLTLRIFDNTKLTLGPQVNVTHL